MADSWDILKLLADSTRVRILSLLDKEELSVAELQEVLDMGQSRISSHLGLLRQGELVHDRREGKKTFYALNADFDVDGLTLLKAACRAVERTDQIREDGANLKRILEKRKQQSEQYFNSVAGRLGKNYCPGRSWEAIGHFLLHLTPKIKIADLGAGEGLISQLLARRAEEVVCVDNSSKMVEFGSELAAKNGFTNLNYKLGDIEAVPLKDSSFDLALLSQALHHAQHPDKAIAEAYRILKPGGQIMIIDLMEHNFEKARELYADVWLGFSENKLYQYLKDAGFRKIEVNVVARETEAPNFQTILASGVKG
ncbi:MAG: metalloregulator ArsR/SmtB family transcription factor [Opitutales bacterium]|jgi:ubiquinone/menaquinone biosynthesis C-methylase UbiE/DNA-binding transcriptional ArsR family regulator|nr:metalloregulator ArsR/SmtB family transcription factor [Opitutales bacterium]MDP4643365.1 metalloregulator ArsR/SmtB family transcription factor [Opitutales bacterium]MDP4778055.1 metalloregulator ArsR/SmtB family transcription factor [Opitutales bacterium]MDP4883690.1 metalloregulator ArsR/SmtB family transcription factor [Opitutales bacterium]MDP5079788.1 metalloregulator ArsR/SmtB family transcription factor [Opitutales bacterium]